MKGSYIVKVHNRRVTYTVEIERNITIICGDSGTGKTTLINSLIFYEELGEKSGVTIESVRPCRVLRGNEWYEKLQKISGSIIFIDEGNEFVETKEFAVAIRNTDNYYVIVSRESLYQLPYSVNSVLQLKRTGSRFKHTYNRTYPMYDKVPRFGENKLVFDLFITEDTNAGNQMFSLIATKRGIDCISAGGKNRILSAVKENCNRKSLVIADGAAFGSNMAAVYQYLLLHEDSMLLYLPESFEWLVLSALFSNNPEIKSILTNPADHIDCQEHISWEQYFTYLLRQTTRGTPAEYNKSRLKEYYFGEDKVEKIEKIIEQGME